MNERALFELAKYTDSFKMHIVERTSSIIKVNVKDGAFQI